MKLWRSDPRLRPQTASDGLRGRIWGRGLKRPQSSDLRSWSRTASEVGLRSRPRTASSGSVEVWRSDYSSNWLKSRFLKFLASDDLGGRIWGHPVHVNRGRRVTLDFSHDLKKCFLLWFFDTPNSTYQLTVSEAAEVNADRPKTTAPMGKGYMPILNLLGSLVWPCISDKQEDRIRGLLIYM